LFLDEGLIRNFRFLVLEVIKQVDAAQRALEGGSDVSTARLASRDDYIDHLRTLVENKCFAILRRGEAVDKSRVDFLRSTTTITTNLERIADHAVSAVRQGERLGTPGYLLRYEPARFFEVIFASLELIYEAYELRDTTKAVQIAQGELDLDDLYQDRFARILADLADADDVADPVTSLFIFHYLERIGDCLQNIGEAILFAKMGERLKMRSYKGLSSALHPDADEPSLDEASFQGIWGTRSGSQIGKVRSNGVSDEGHDVIFKEGDPKKIRREMEAMERWAGVVPGLAPRVLRYREGERASMLVQYLEGQTLLEIVMYQPLPEVERALGRVHDTIGRVWTETLKPEPVRPRFLEQLESRLHDVYSVHPHFREGGQQIGTVRVATLHELLEASRHLDDVLEAPFSVLGHGDFNLDNVIFNAREDSVHFIDLYRSKRMDYVQDVSVHLVSAFRVPVFRPRRRAPLNRVIERMLDFARDFARVHGDATFEARLAMGLVRSFVSSTRFEIRRPFADEMLRRALYLLERLEVQGQDALADFRIPRDVLLYG
jgi:phosphate uptake regulator/aminoglycoside phosphotransferase (APT) family kinase protein